MCWRMGKACWGRYLEGKFVFLHETMLDFLGFISAFGLGQGQVKIPTIVAPQFFIPTEGGVREYSFLTQLGQTLPFFHFFLQATYSIITLTMANKQLQLELDGRTRTLHDALSLAKKAEVNLEKLIKQKAAAERFANGQGWQDGGSGQSAEG